MRLFKRITVLYVSMRPLQTDLGSVKDRRIGGNDVVRDAGKLILGHPKESCMLVIYYNNNI